MFTIEQHVPCAISVGTTNHYIVCPI